MTESPTPSGVPMMTDLNSDFISGAVSLARLLSLYGYEYMEEVDSLWGAEGTDFLVLFANDEETEYALMPVGPAHPHKKLSAALQVTHGEFHAVCHCAARDGVRPVPLTLPVEGWRRIAKAFPDEAETLESLITNAGSSEDALLAILRHLTATARELRKQQIRAAEREQEILKREGHILTSAKRIEELMQRYGKWETLKEQSALLEQREKYVREAEERLIKRAQEMELHQEEINQEMSNLEAHRAKTAALR